jgi:toxin ParE1/3/4
VPRVRREPFATADLEDIWLHIALDNVDAAEGVIDQIYRAEDRLGEFPDLGRARHELAEGVRNWPVGSYVIFYRTEPGAVVIIRILHGARDLGQAF